MLSCRQNYSNITFRSQKSKKYNKIDNNNNNINSKYYESTNENKSSTHNKVNNTPPTTSHWPQKKTVFILRDSMVKKLNSFLLTRKPNHNFFVRLDHLIRPRWDACTTILNQLRDFDPDYIILHCGTNDPNSDRKSSQIAGEIIDRSLIRITFQFYY